MSFTRVAFWNQIRCFYDFLDLVFFACGPYSLSCCLALLHPPHSTLEDILYDSCWIWKPQACRAIAFPPIADIMFADFFSSLWNAQLGLNWILLSERKHGVFCTYFHISMASLVISGNSGQRISTGHVPESYYKHRRVKAGDKLGLWL